MLTDDQLKFMEACAPMLVAEVRRLRGELHTANLQVHDNQTLHEDYVTLLKCYDDAMEGIKHYREAVVRDEETIKELKSRLHQPVERSETFREVRDERDKLREMTKEFLEALDNASYHTGSGAFTDKEDTHKYLALKGRLRDLLGMD